MSDSESGETEADDSSAIVLDFLPHGRTEDDRPQYQKQPLLYALDGSEFRLFEVIYEDPPDVSIGDRVDIEADAVKRARNVEYDDLSGGAASELDYAVDELVEAEEDRFVDFFNDAQPITLRLHQLNLLPGIGKKLRNAILDERERRPFDSFADLSSRVSGLHDPKDVLVERILEEFQQDDLKYRIFARREEE